MNSNKTLYAPYADERLRNVRRFSLISSRSTALREIESRLRTFTTPRLDAILLAALCALIGVAIAFALGVAGVESMALRYPLAIALTYPFFLGMLWWWSREPWLSGNVDFPSNWPSGNGGGSASGRTPDATFQGEGGDFGGAGASDDWGSATESGRFASEMAEGTLGASASAEELAPVVFVAGVTITLIVFTCAMLAGVVTFVWSAPTLLAELVLDAGAASALFCFTRNAIRRDWLGTAARRTAPAFCGLALVFGLAGFGLQRAAPDAMTMGDAIRAVRAH